MFAMVTVRRFCIAPTRARRVALAEFLRTYRGISGDCWFLEEDVVGERVAIHEEIERSLVWIERRSPTGERVGAEVCVDEPLARRYLQRARQLDPSCYLLALSDDEDELDAVAGFDIGHIDGGFSLIETEIAGNAQLEARFLNGVALFRTRSALEEYLRMREASAEYENLEEAEGLVVIAVEIVVDVGSGSREAAI